MASQAGLVLGWDVGGTKSSVLVADSAGTILAKAAWPSRVERGPEAMWGDFVEAALPLLQQFPAVEQVGVSIGGPMNPLTGEILSPPHLPGWDRVPLRGMLEERFGLPATVEHDAVACLLAEALWGAAKGASHAAYLTSGTGFGAGVLVEGRVLRGPQGESVEIGHLRLAEAGPVLFGKAGSAEAFCSGTGMALLAQGEYPHLFPPGTTLKEVAAQAAAGGVEGRKILETGAKYTGRVIAFLADLFWPQVVIVGSLARYLPGWWLEAVREEALREALSRAEGSFRITAGELGERLQDLSPIAAARYPLELSGRGK